MNYNHPTFLCPCRIKPLKRNQPHCNLFPPPINYSYDNKIMVTKWLALSGRKYSVS